MYEIGTYMLKMNCCMYTMYVLHYTVLTLNSIVRLI